MLSHSELGHGKIQNSKPIAGLPRPASNMLLVGYALLLLLMGALIINVRSLDIIWSMMMLPIFFGAILYSRSVYLAMMALYASGSALLIVLAPAKDPGDSARTILVFLVAVGIGAETLHRFIDWLERARAALRASEERFRSLSVMAPLGIFETDSEGHYIYTNPRWEIITGLSSEAGQGQGWVEVAHPEERKALLDDWQWAVRQNREFTREFRLSSVGSNVRWVRLQSAVKYLDDGTPGGRVGTLEDITEKRAAAEALRQANEVLEKRVAERTERLTQAIKQLETEVAERQHAAEALRQSEERFSKAFQASPSPLLITSLVDGRTIDMNNSFLEVSGYTREEMLGHSPVEMRLWKRPEDRARLVSMVNNQQSVRDYEVVLRRQSGEERTMLISAELVTLDEEKCLLSIATDITERKALEQHLRDYAETQRTILQQRVAAQESERRRLSMDVHDGPLQSLGVSMLALDRAIRRLERGERDLAYGELRYLRNSLSGTVAEMRSVLADLSVDTLTAHGLTVALHSNVEHFSEVTGIHVEMDDNLEMRLPGELELLLYRLAQEALANVRKHAEATKVLIRVETEGNEIVMLIRDDGRGFDPSETPRHRRDGDQLGLASMQERVQAMRGELKIVSSPGSGTSLLFRCPIPTAPEA